MLGATKRRGAEAKGGGQKKAAPEGRLGKFETEGIENYFLMSPSVQWTV